MMWVVNLSLVWTCSSTLLASCIWTRKMFRRLWLLSIFIWECQQGMVCPFKGPGRVTHPHPNWCKFLFGSKDPGNLFYRLDDDQGRSRQYMKLWREKRGIT